MLNVPRGPMFIYPYDQQVMRVAWFSPLPPVPSGIAALNANLLPHLEGNFSIDRFEAQNAHDFVWKHRRHPYDLVVYQLGNASWHDYMWGYLVRYPGLAVVHDPRLHHARARLLLRSGRVDDYRREFWYDHPAAVRDFVEYAVAGLGGPIYHQWSMVRVVMETARAVAVHSPVVAGDLRDEFRTARIETIRLGTPDAGRSTAGPSAARARVRAALGIGDAATLFAAFGKITAEKRIAAIARAFGALAAERDVHLMLAGDTSGYPLDRDVGALPASRVHVTGYLPDEEIDAYVAAADVCLCLRWPTALESSASWLQCLSAGRATILSGLAHLADIHTIDPLTGRRSHAHGDPVAMTVDVLEEDAALVAAMRTLAADAAARDALGRAGRAYWSANHTMETMADDYRRVIASAAGQAAPAVQGLPAHFSDDRSSTARAVAERFGVDLDILR